MSSTVLVVDDDRANLESVCRIFQREGVSTLSAANGQEALEHLRKPEVGIIVSDMMMPGVDGQALLRAARAMRPDVEVVLMTAYATVETAVAAMREGAYDFITKPLKRHSLVKAVQKAMEKQALVAENRDLKAQLAALGPRSLVGQSPAFRAFMDLLKQVAPTTATLLLLGESGTGKELAARFIHEASPRVKGPFVAVNCAAVPESLLEAELFGHEKGAFTGAVARKEGRFERANAGTLFLDEVGEMSPSAQVKLLRVLQEGEVERVGGTQTIKVDTRVVAATNKDLQLEVKEGRFREDLYFRLNVVEVRIPSLASRREDVPLLAEYFAGKHAGTRGATVTTEAREALMAYSWPGNVRELENAVARALALNPSGTILIDDLPEPVRLAAQQRGTAPLTPHAAHSGGEPQALDPIMADRPTLDELTRRYAERILRELGGNKTRAAEALGIDRKTLSRLLGRTEE